MDPLALPNLIKLGGDFGLALINTSMANDIVHPCKTSANFHDFVPLPPYRRQFFYYDLSADPSLLASFPP